MKISYILGAILLSLALGGYSWWSITAESSTIPGDFSRDRVSDLAIGVPGEDVPDTLTPYVEAGAINLLYGKARQGLVYTGNQYLHRDTDDVEGDTESNAYFGTALAIGDFNCDGTADLAVGVPGQTVSTANHAGAVHIFYGYYFGLVYDDPLDDFIIDQNWSCITASSPEKDDHFGQVLAAGDFDGDGCSDLAIGVPDEDYTVSYVDAGMVHVLYGSSGGFLTTKCGNYIQDWLSGGEESESDDRFGAALAAGNFGTDAYDDLAIGAPGEDFTDWTRLNVGVVHVIYGTSSGLGTFNQLWYQGHNGMEGSAQEGDRFGEALATGNFDGGGGDDLAIGVPGQDATMITNSSGAVHLIYSNTGNLVSTGNEVFDQDSITLTPNDPVPEPDDEFGAALTAGDFDGDSYIDLAIGVPGDQPGLGTTCGAVDLFYGGLGGLQTTGAQEWSQYDTNLLDTCEINDHFGAALAAGNFNHDPYADLAIGVPEEDDGRGAVQVLYGTYNGIVATGNQLWSQDSSWIDGIAEQYDYFGSALAARPVLIHQVYLPVVRK